MYIDYSLEHCKNELKLFPSYYLFKHAYERESLFHICPGIAQIELLQEHLKYIFYLWKHL